MTNHYYGYKATQEGKGWNDRPYISLNNRPLSLINASAKLKNRPREGRRRKVHFIRPFILWDLLFLRPLFWRLWLIAITRSRSLSLSLSPLQSLMELKGYLYLPPARGVGVVASIQGQRDLFVLQTQLYCTWRSRTTLHYNFPGFYPLEKLEWLWVKLNL